MSAIGIVSTILKADVDFVALVPKANVHPIMWPQTAQPPAVILNVVGDSDEQMLEAGAKYYQTRLRLEAVAESGTAAVAIGDAMRVALQDVIKRTIGAFVDVDIAYLTYFTDWADDRSMARHTSDFSVRWRAAA